MDSVASEQQRRTPFMICSVYANLLLNYLKVSYGNLQKVVFQPITESLYVLGP